MTTLKKVIGMILCTLALATLRACGARNDTPAADMVENDMFQISDNETLPGISQGAGPAFAGYSPENGSHKSFPQRLSFFGGI